MCQKAPIFHWEEITSPVTVKSKRLFNNMGFLDCMCNSITYFISDFLHIAKEDSPAHI